MDRNRLKLGELKVESFEAMPQIQGLNGLVNTCTGVPQLCSRCCIDVTCNDC